MRDPAGQLNASAKSALFISVPRTLLRMREKRDELIITTNTSYYKKMKLAIIIYVGALSIIVIGKYTQCFP